MNSGNPKDNEDITVVDRRHVAAEGRSRDEIPERQSNRAAAEQARDRATDGTGSSSGQTDAHNDAPAIDFLTFIASLATNAMAALGLLPDAEARGLPRDLQLAREYIDIIAMLKDKTRGNLSAEEDQAVERLLTDLRLKYIEGSRQGR